jgi:23S rRNA (pseudouridine1915-N3)-methyltransferase
MKLVWIDKMFFEKNLKIIFAPNTNNMNIEIWSPGKENEAYIEEGMRLYFKKTMPWCPVELIVLSLPKKFATADAATARRQEEEMILKRLQPHHHLVVLDERGKMHNSIQWAAQLQQMMNMGVKTLVLLIGGAWGVTDGVKAKAKQVWSLSPLVFPHQLVRLIIAEQLYRSFSILNNSQYHHE